MLKKFSFRAGNPTSWEPNILDTNDAMLAFLMVSSCAGSVKPSSGAERNGAVVVYTRLVWSKRERIVE